MSAQLVDVRRSGGRLVALVQMHHPAHRGDQPLPHGELITVRDGRITEIASYPTLEEAQAAAGTAGYAPVQHRRWTTRLLEGRRDES